MALPVNQMKQYWLQLCRQFESQARHRLW